MSGGIGDVMIDEPPCTCKQVKRRGDLGTPWVEVAYDPECTYHFPQAAKAATTTREK